MDGLRRRFVGIIMGVGLAVASCLGLARPASATERRALLIEIGRYSSSKVPVLTPGGIQQDAALMRNVLQQHWQFAPNQMQTLSGVGATRANIRAAMQRLAGETQPGDAVVFYFSGHGGRSRGRLSLCPWDAALDSADNDISEEELSRWASELKSPNVTVILDCCFSEYGQSRSPTVLYRTKFLPRSGAAPAQPLHIAPEHAVVLAASDVSEEAQEIEAGRGEDGRTHWAGLYTLRLCAALKNAAPQATYRAFNETLRQQVGAYIVRAFQGNTVSQTPQIAGAAVQQDRNLFASPTTGAAPDPGPDVPTPPISRRSRLRVRVEAPAPEKAQVIKALQEWGIADVGDTDADAWLQIVRRGSRFTANLLGSDGKSPLRDSLPLFEASRLADLLAQIRPALENHAILHSLASLENNGSALTLTLQTDKLVYAIGDALRVTLKVGRNGRAASDNPPPYYLTLVHINASGTAQALFPNQWRADNQVISGHEYAIPGAELGLGQFDFTVSQPTGRETLIAIVTTEPKPWRDALLAASHSSFSTLNLKGITVAAANLQQRPATQWTTAIASFVVVDRRAASQP